MVQKIIFINCGKGITNNAHPSEIPKGKTEKTNTNTNYIIRLPLNPNVSDSSLGIDDTERTNVETNQPTSVNESAQLQLNKELES